MLERVSSILPVKVTTSGGFRKRRVVTLDCRTLVRAPNPTLARRRNAAVKAHKWANRESEERERTVEIMEILESPTAQGASPFAPKDLKRWEVA